MRKLFLFSIIIGLLCWSDISLAAINETVSVTAKPKDNPQQDEDDIEGHFDQSPSGDNDRINVTNDNVKYVNSGVYNDPVNDGALLTCAQNKSPVKVDVDGRSGVGAMYWVTVTPYGPGEGPSNGDLLWADVEDMEAAGALVLKDKNSGRGKSDLTDSDANTPELYCMHAEDEKGDVEFWLNADSGTYSWVIKQGASTIASGTLNTGNNWKASKSDLVVGFYTLEVTKSGDQNFKRRIDFGITSIKVFIDASFSTVLDDHPETEEAPRSPKYMFTKNNCVYIEARGFGKNPGTQETLMSIVAVTSESRSSNPIGITLKETGNGTGIFRNYLGEPDLLGERLRIWHESGEGLYDSILVKGEEVLTFALRIPNTQTTIDEYKVMVDRAEIGIQWQSCYADYSAYPTLNTAHDSMGEKLTEKICAAPFQWTENFDKGDLDCKESDFAKTSDNADGIDSVDLVTWTGHATTDGGSDSSPNYLVFFVDKVGGVKQPPGKVYHAELKLGDSDAEWVVFNTCRYLNKDDNTLKVMMGGAHLILGYVPRMTVYRDAGTWFGEKLKTVSIKQAWFDQAAKYQNSGKIARVFGVTTAESDVAYGANNGTLPVVLSRDPGSGATYTHWDYTLP